MKKIISICLSICASIVLFACKDSSPKHNFSLVLEGIEEDSIEIFMAPFNEKLPNEGFKLYSSNNKFTLDTLIDKLYYGKILTNFMYESLPNGEKMLMPSKSLRFFIKPNENIEIVLAESQGGYQYDIKGNKLSKQYIDFRQLFLSDLEEVSEVMFQIEKASAMKSPDSIIISLRERDDKAYTSYLEKSQKFIEDNPELEYSAFLLWSRSKEEMLELFPNFSENVKKSEYGSLLQEQIDIWSKVEVGNQVPNFEYIDINNDKIKLSDFSGKYVVIDFWGTWCNPCKREIPEMKSLYEKAKANIEIIGIPCRDKKERVEQAVADYKIGWRQILNDEKSNDLTKTFGIYGFPTKIIVDPNGVIQNIYVGSENNFFEKMNKITNNYN